jgi:hypothetical protein
MVQAHATKQQYEKAFEGLEFPTSLSAIMKRARDVGGIDREVHEMIGHLPDRQYESLEDLFGALRRAYTEARVSPEAIPV